MQIQAWLLNLIMQFFFMTLQEREFQFKER